MSVDTQLDYVKGGPGEGGRGGGNECGDQVRGGVRGEGNECGHPVGLLAPHVE